MALEDIFRALQEQADRDVEVVLDEARAHAEVILEEAEREATEIRANRVAEAERTAKAKSAQSLNSVRLEARKKLAGVRERAVRQVFEDARGVLGTVRAKPEYPSVFRALVDEALSGVSADFELWVDPADADLARQVLAERGSSAAVRPEIETAGGVVVALDGGRIMRRNTLEDRLDKLQSVAQADVAELVFQ